MTDPWVDFGPGSRVYGTSLAFDDTGPDNAIFVSTSADGGMTWGPPVQVVKDTEFAFFNDRQSLTVDDFPSSPFYGRVYVGWDRLASKGPGNAYTGDGLVAHSTDGGASFSRPILAVPTGNNEQTLTNLPVVLPASATTRTTPDFDQAAAAFAGGFFLGDYQGLGVSGTTFTPFFVATLATQANGQVGSDVFATSVD